MSEYKILRWNGMYYLEQDVRRHMRHGWMPHGQNFRDNGQDCQAMIRVNKVESSRSTANERKPIVTCKYCAAMNAFDNPRCVQCGGPMGA